MARETKKRLPNLALLTSTIEGAQLASEPTAPAAEADSGRRVLELPIAALWLEHQPREIVPDETLQRLIAEGRAQPTTLLESLREVAATDAYYAEVLAKLEGLGQSIASQGVLQPIEVVSDGARYVVRDGHRRSLGSLLAGRTTVPAVVVVEGSPLEAIARPLVLNVQREDLTALEKGAALLRLAVLVGQRLAGEASGDGSAKASAGPITLEALLGGSDDSVEGDARPAGSRALAAAVRERACAMVGLQPRTYYRLLALNRLTPEARAIGKSLTEGQLRALVGIAAEDQAEIVAFVVKRGLTAKETATLAQVARAGDRDAVRRVMARLAKEDGGRTRAAVSWEPLIHAVPKDVWRRCQALRSELEALPVEHRRARLDAMWEQDALLSALREEFGRIFVAHGYRGPGTRLEDEQA